MLSNEDKVDLGPFLMQFVMRNPFKMDDEQAVETVTDLTVDKSIHVTNLSSKKVTKIHKFEIKNCQTKPLNFSHQQHFTSSEDGGLNNLKKVQNTVFVDPPIKIKIEKTDDSYNNKINVVNNIEKDTDTLAKLREKNKDKYEQRYTINYANNPTNFFDKYYGHREHMLKKNTPYLVGRVLLARARSYKLENKLKHNLKTLSKLKCNYTFLRQHFITFEKTFQKISKEVLDKELNF